MGLEVFVLSIIEENPRPSAPGDISAMYKEKWLHVLGYFINYTDSDIRQWCAAIEKGREENVDAQIAKLCEAGFYLDKAKVLENGPQPIPICYSRAIFLDERNNHNQLVRKYRSQDNYILKFCIDWIVTGRP